MKPLSNSHKALASLVILGLLAMTATPARAALVKLETGGTITGGDAFLALTGQLWSLVLVYDTEAVTDEFANDPGMGNYHATATTTPIISYKIQYGGFEALAQSPMDADANAVRLTLLNFPTAKIFHFEMHSEPLLPAWAGKRVSSFSFFFDIDSASASWSDALPMDDGWVKDINFSPSATNGDLFFPGVNGGPLQDLRASVSTVKVTNLTPIPEPGTVVLLTLAALFGGITRLRRRKTPTA